MSAYEFDAKILVGESAVGRIWTENEGRSIEVAFINNQYRDSFRKTVAHMTKMSEDVVDHLSEIEMLDKTLAGALSWFTVHLNEMQKLSRSKTVFCVPNTPPGEYYFDNRPYHPGVEDELRRKYNCPDLSVLNPALSNAASIKLNPTLQKMLQYR